MAEGDPPSKKDFFVSYNKADRQWAEWAAWHLEEAEYTVAIQAWDFGPGSNFVLEMDRAVQECERVLAVLSPDYVSSLFTKPEWAAYFAQDPTSEKRRIISLRVRECELKGLLAPIVYADIVGKSENEAKSSLLDAVKIGRRKPENAPGFPGRKVATRPRFPGALPDIWNVPHLRNPNFTEPGERLTELHNALRSGKPAALTQALAGLGGVGKTQLAIEYAYRYASDYSLVWWVRSEQAATLAADYAALAIALDLPEKNAAEQAGIISAVRQALQHRRDWLLIFDNANAPEEVRDYLPAMGAHVLITSRHAAWGGVAQTVPVKKWAPAVAAEFLVKRTGQTDGESAKALARELDYLPLALEQAAAYIDAAQKTLSGYLTMFRQHELELLKRGKPATDYPATVGTTWEISFQGLERESPGGAALLQLCAFLAPDDIPRDAIVSGSDALPEAVRETVCDGLAFDEAVSAIRRYSLIDAGGESVLSMHRLVQAVVRDRLDSPHRRRWAAAAVQVINKAFPSNATDVSVWNEYDRLLPHAIAAASFAEIEMVGLDATANLLNEVGLYQVARGEYANGKINHQRALEINEGIYGPDHLNVAACLNNIGRVLKEVEDYHGAKAALVRTLAIEETQLRNDDPSLAKTLNNLGTVLRALGEVSEAKESIERALAINEATYGPDHPEVAVNLNNLANVLRTLNDLTGAMAAVEHALEIDEKVFGSNHPTVGIRLNNLASLQAQLGLFDEARVAFRRALTIMRESLGEDHPHTRAVEKNLSDVSPKE